MALPSLKDSFIADSYLGYLHTNNVPVSGNNLAWVYDGRGNKSALRIGGGNNDGTSGVNPGVSINGTLSATEISFPGFDTIIDFLYPIGSIFFSADAANPEDRFVGTTWERVGEGKFIASVGEGTDKNDATFTVLSGNDLLDGEYTHELSGEEMPEHTHDIRTTYVSGADDNAGNSGYLGSSGRALRYSGQLQSQRSLTVLNAGGNTAHNNTPPYMGLYVWKRLT